MQKVIIAVLLSILSLNLAYADEKQYGPVNVSATSVSGDQVRGPAKVKLVGVNVIQSNVTIGVNVSYPSGPDLTLPFIPKFPGTGAQTTTPPAAPQTAAAAAAIGHKAASGALARNALPSATDVGPVFNDLVNDLNNYETARFSLQSNIQAGIDTVSAANGRVTSFVSSSNAALAADPKGVSLLSGVTPLLGGYIDPALGYRWPNADVSSLETNLAVLKNNLAALQDNPGWSAWIASPGNKSSYDAVVSRASDLITLASGLEASNNKSAASLADSQTKLQQWGAILTSVRDGGAPSFARTIDIGCSFGFANNKNSVVEMQTTDRLAPTGTPATKLDIVTVICSSPLSISGGFGFSTVPERQISFIQSENSSGQVISVFGYSAKSNFKPLPLILLNTRLHEWNDDFAIHVSNGAVVDIKTGAAGGTDVEFISGVTVSYRRSLFVTGGFHAGRVQSLSGGFSIGQQVPSSVSTPPTENRWNPGFVLAFTYKLK